MDKQSNVYNSDDDSINHSDSNDDSDNSSDDESEITLFDTSDIPYDLNTDNHIRFEIIHQNIISRKNNLVVFVSQKGEPCDKGAQALAEAGMLPEISDVTIRCNPACVRPIPSEKASN